MLQLLKAARKGEFDGYMAKSLDAATKANLGFRMWPYGLTSYFRHLQSGSGLHPGVAGQIR